MTPDYGHWYTNHVFLFSIAQGTFVFSIIKYSPLKFSNSYVYPLWANILGWFIATVSLSFIPLFVVYQLVQGEGTLRQVSFLLFMLLNLKWVVRL